jgi:uncharacterized protein YqgV (UPF0045/DUF77 family)
MSELKFTNREVEARYYAALREAGITHMSWAMGTIVSEANIDDILADVKQASDCIKQIREKEKSERED